MLLDVMVIEILQTSVCVAVVLIENNKKTLCIQ